MRNSIVLSAVSLLIGTSVYAADYLTADQFEMQVVGKTMSSKTQKGKPFTSVFMKGGSGTMQIKGIKSSPISWSYSEDTLCWEAYKTKECDKVAMTGAGKADFVDAKTGKTNNSYSIK